MKLITRDTDYAIRALCYMAKEEERVISVKELVSTLSIPKPFLRKILQTLNSAKLLKSYKGKGGGFKLSRKPKNIFVIDIIKIFQGQVKLSEHIFKKGICPHLKTCILKRRLDRIEGLVIVELKRITIESLLSDVERDL
ncbi:MAG: Rrf2 family transcriptional regulator [Candidatus Omnitrophota bacterium]